MKVSTTNIGIKVEYHQCCKKVGTMIVVTKMSTTNIGMKVEYHQCYVKVSSINSVAAITSVVTMSS